MTMQPKMQYAAPNLEFIRFEQDDEITISVVPSLPDDGSGDAVIIW